MSFFTPFFCGAQHFTGQCDIPAVNRSGYYHLQLTPEVVAVSQPNLEDIRIKNSQSGKEIPYLLYSENPKTQTSSFQAYRIVENYFDNKDSVTRIVIDNEAKEEIKRFYIVIQNAEISKYISVKGSDDNEVWYVVKQKAPTNSIVKYDTESEMLIVDIPIGRYRYYEILVGNPQKDPVRVLSAGKYRYGEILGTYAEVDLGSFIQKDSTDKHSYIYFPDAKHRYFINKIHVEIEKKQPYYYRQAFSPRDHFFLSSELNSTIDNYDAYIDSSTAAIVIDNKDNSPLKITKIKAFQLSHYLTLYLEKDESYTLYSGNKTLPKPQYDIEYFEKSIPDGLTVLKTGALKKIAPQPEKVAEPPKQHFWETQIFLWAVICGVGLLLGWICYTMIGEIKKK